MVFLRRKRLSCRTSLPIQRKPTPPNWHGNTERNCKDTNPRALTKHPLEHGLQKNSSRHENIVTSSLENFGFQYELAPMNDVNVSVKDFASETTKLGSDLLTKNTHV